MKAIEQYFHVVLFIMLYKVVLTFKPVNETLVCDHSNVSYWAVPSCGTVYYDVQYKVILLSLWMKYLCVTIQMTSPSVWLIKCLWMKVPLCGTIQIQISWSKSDDHTIKGLGAVVLA